VCYNEHMKKSSKTKKSPAPSEVKTETKKASKSVSLVKFPSPKSMIQPTTQFTQALAREIVKNLTAFGEMTTRPFHRAATAETRESIGTNPVVVDTSVLIDGRILPIINSGFMMGTFIIPQFILTEVQHIADDSDPMRRAKGRRALDVINKIKAQKVNPWLKTKIVTDDPTEVKEVDSKLVALAKRWGAVLLTVDFNLAHVARAQSVRVLNVNDLAQAMKVALVAGEEFTIKITHEGREREQGVGYLSDGTMVVVENAKDRVGQDVHVTVTKIHQTPAGQLFFARMK
jgi:uncharacterized protein YacL